jgi:hypothetical protein
MSIAALTITLLAAMPVMPQAQKVPQGYVKVRTRVLYRVPLPAHKVVAWYVKMLNKPAKRVRAAGADYTVIARRESALKIPGSPVPVYSEAALVWRGAGGGCMLMIIDDPEGGVAAGAVQMHGAVRWKPPPREPPPPSADDLKTFGQPPREADLP